MSYLSYTSLPGPEKKHVRWQTKYTQLQHAAPRPTPSIGPLVRKVCISLTFLVGIATFAGIGVVAGLMDKSGQHEFVLHGIKCATCEEIAQHNPLLLISGNNGKPMGCAGIKSGAGEETFDIVKSGMTRCWVFEQGKDDWLNPIRQ